MCEYESFQITLKISIESGGFRHLRVWRAKDGEDEDIDKRMKWSIRRCSRQRHPAFILYVLIHHCSKRPICSTIIHLSQSHFLILTAPFSLGQYLRFRHHFHIIFININRLERNLKQINCNDKTCVSHFVHNFVQGKLQDNSILSATYPPWYA